MAAHEGASGLLDDLPYAVFRLVEADGGPARFTAASPALRALLGLPPSLDPPTLEEVVSRLPAACAEDLWRSHDRALADDEEWVWEGAAGPRHLQLRAKATIGEGFIRWEGVLLDVSGDVAARRAAEERQRSVSMLAALSRVLIERFDADAEELARESLHEILRALDVEYASLYRLPGDELVATRVTEARSRHLSRSRDAADVARVDLASPAFAAWRAKLAAGEAVVEADVEGDPRLSGPGAPLRGRGTKSLLVVPLPHARGASGFMVFEACLSARAYSSTEIDALAGAAVMLSSVLARKAAERDLILARDEALRASRMKSTFVATISHEIRTPMNGIVGVADLLARAKLPAEQAELVDVVRSSARALLAIVEDVLDFSKIEAGRLEVETLPLRYAEVLSDVRAAFAEPASRKGLRLTLDVDPRLGAPALGDPLRLRQILTNLVGNAVKFTTRGFVAIRGELLDAEGAPRVRLTVADSGIGIDAAARARIFESFEQADSSTTRRYGGTGLGLSIARRLVALLGGTLDVESEPGRGSVFTCELPFVPGAEEPAAPAPSAQPALDGAPVRVLLAEDNPVNQRVALRMLAALGVEADAVDDGVGALEALRDRRYDLVLMDCHMPGLDGVEATRRIRAEERSGRTPVVALTANALTEERERCLSAGMDDFVPKPVTLEVLRATVERWAGRATGRRPTSG